MYSMTSAHVRLRTAQKRRCFRLRLQMGQGVYETVPFQASSPDIATDAPIQMPRHPYAAPQPPPHCGPSSPLDTSTAIRPRSPELLRPFPHPATLPAPRPISRTIAEMPPCPQPNAAAVHPASHLRGCRPHSQQIVSFLLRNVVPGAHAPVAPRP